MELFNLGAIFFLGFALIGLILLIVGIIFLFKNIKWKGEKDRQGKKATENIVGMVIFSIMIFFGGVWLVCFGVSAVVFYVFGCI